MDTHYSLQDDLATVQEFFAHGITLNVLLGIPPGDLDQLYAYACQLYDAGDYSSAQAYYQLLCQLCHWQFDYWLALGLCCQRLGQHDQAVLHFCQAGLLRLSDPRPAYLAGLSHQLCGRTELAHQAFCTALKWCANKEQYADLKADILSQSAMNQHIQKEPTHAH